MQEVAIVIDSTAYADPQYFASGHVFEVSLQVIHGDQSFLENRAPMGRGEFVELLRRSPKPPTTSQPSVGAFLEIYEPLVQAGKAVISIHLSGGLSGTVRAAQQAAGMVEGEIHVVDSQTTSTGMLFLVDVALQALDEGKGCQGALAAIEEVQRTSRLLILVDSLTHLQKGGRIGGASALLGSLLQIKPILTVREGKVEIFDKVRTRSKALQRIVAEALSQHQQQPLRRLAIAHVDNEALALELKELLNQAFPGMDVPVQTIGPVIATHIGPGAVGCFYY